MVDLLAIVVSYNTRELTREAVVTLLDSLERCGRSFEVVVYDNASSDGSQSLGEDFAGRVRFIASGTNHGFAKANNIAARLQRSDRILLVNPDTVIGTDSVRALLDFADANASAGIWGGRTLFPDGRLNPASCWRKPSLWSLLMMSSGLAHLFPGVPSLNPEAYGGWDRDSEREVDIVSGCWFLIDRALWDTLGGFDEAFFMYGEEADLCLRARALGARPMVTNRSVITHIGGASERVHSDKIVKIMRAKAHLVRRHFGRFSRDPALALLSCWPLTRSLGCVSLSRRHRARAAVWAQVWRRRKEWLSS